MVPRLLLLRGQVGGWRIERFPGLKKGQSVDPPIEKQPPFDQRVDQRTRRIDDAALLGANGNPDRSGNAQAEASSSCSSGKVIQDDRGCPEVQRQFDRRPFSRIETQD